ncbi:hypothetical protein IW261DRAFT_1426391 [Armillaria novae-zelandiae]|uniref:Uncharacterized protein n=1 Tax=Armillaria novae-zelandiae TaxID=153914 RepID=A0AA39NL34_9AGAR|nr:hypothetical protein IW261DRAFT_1426391 [Armillaria novae-zelandiae]
MNDVVGSSHSLTVVPQEEDSESSISVTPFTPVFTIVINPTPTLASSASTVPTSNTDTAPPLCASHERFHRSPHPPIGSLALLLLLLGTVIFIFKWKRMTPYSQPILPFSPPSDVEKKEPISPVLNAETVHSSTDIEDPAESDMRTDTFGGTSRPLSVVTQIGGSTTENTPVPYLQEVPQAVKGKLTKVARAKRNSFGALSEHLPVDSGSASEQAGHHGEERPRAALGDIETEVPRLKTQVYRILIQHEA